MKTIWIGMDMKSDKYIWAKYGIGKKSIQNARIVLISCFFILIPYLFHICFILWASKGSLAPWGGPGTRCGGPLGPPPGRLRVHGPCGSPRHDKSMKQVWKTCGSIEETKNTYDKSMDLFKEHGKSMARASQPGRGPARPTLVELFILFQTSINFQDVQYL